VNPGRLTGGIVLLVGIATGGLRLPGAGPPAAGSALRPLCVDAAPQHHAALVLEHANSDTKTVCVGFDADQVSGKQILLASGIDYGLSNDANYGDAVCRVDYEPLNYPPDCLKLPSYWFISIAAYGHSWAAAGKGIDALQLRDGDAIGLRYVPQDSPAAPPTAAGICPPPLVEGLPSPQAQPPGRPPAPTGGSAATGGPGPGSDSPSATASSPDPATSAAIPSPGLSGTPYVNTPTPGPTSRPGRASRPSTGPDPGLVAGGIAAAALIAMLLAQLFLPRLRQ
jgi:hypothetical protein